ncbi:S8 family serine peptidase [Streptomyces sp. NPDC088788]|uniref:S8 family serine peptidase n=1 Tax=Streptomyces sp. NPDC088788 TaxID=3365898 RepID=UPI0038147C00
MRRAPFLRRPVAQVVGAALAAAVLLAAEASPALADDVELPPVGSALSAGEPCAKASVDKAQRRSWTWESLGLSRSWKFSEGQGVTVAVVDTGVGTSIPALAGRVEAVGEAGADCVGHGSFAAGLIAAAPGAGVGVAGLAPRAEILALRGTSPKGEASPELLGKAIRAAADRGADVIYVGQALATGRAELTAAVAHATERDALVVAPAIPDALPEDGRGKPAVPAPWYWPASAPGVLSVVDFGPSGQRPEDAPPARVADLGAPGDEVVSVGPEGEGHFFGSGSSFAAAYVAGAAALVRARHPDMTAREVSRQLTVASYPDDPPRLDPYGSLTSLLPDRVGRVPRQPAAHVPGGVPDGPLNRALVVAAACVLLVLVVAGGSVVIPRGRARGWRPAGAPASTVAVGGTAGPARLPAMDQG